MSAKDISLSEIADNLPGLLSVSRPETTVRDISHDSRQVEHGFLYVAVSGENFDGHAFIQDAMDNGATALLVDQVQDLGIPQLVVHDTRRAMAWAARSVFGEPDKAVTIAGVTGTNGKTTVIQMLESIFASCGTPAGVIGTLGASMDGSPVRISRTTPEATDLQRLLGTMRDAGATVIAMEVSSHAIELHRSDAISFSVLGFTNLSQDHLDFHGDMESYFAVKSSIFQDPPTSRAVINIDDPWGRRLAERTTLPTCTVSTHGAADVTAQEQISSTATTTFTLGMLGEQSEVVLPLVGTFNVSNALIAAGMAQELGLGITDVVEGLEAMEPIVGRMEQVVHTGPFTVIVDYAHTPEAIAVVLESAKQTSLGRVISIVGAGGDRDKEKRPLMGEAAARFSDLVLVTTDNPRTEDPASIAREVAQGARAVSGTTVEVVLDRREAIRRAVSVAGENDVILVLGKGHETGQDVGTEILPFRDQDEVRDALAAEGWLNT